VGKRGSGEVEKWGSGAGILRSGEEENGGNLEK